MISKNSLKRLLITPGEPSGIGPEITLKLARDSIVASINVVADYDVIAKYNDTLNLGIKLTRINHDDIPETPHIAGSLNIYHVPCPDNVKPGELNPNNSSYVLECLQTAHNLITSGNADALVTGPVHKGIINESEFDFTGHTEYLADLSNARPVMMLASSKMRVALVTTHLPLAKIPEAITRDTIIETVSILNYFLTRHFKTSKPVIIVCGLNPHAGEDGHLGHEEIDTIIPALEKCRSQGINIIGPLPADTAFTETNLAKADAVLAMYHDQGLPVLKHASFGDAVNITLGLPYVRTSVDHGTALSIAGQNLANENSLRQAIFAAIETA